MNNIVKEFLRKVITLTPPYSKLRKSLKKGEAIDFDLEKAVRNAITSVPYYKSYTQYLKNKFSIYAFPIIRKCDIMGKEDSMVVAGRNKRFLSKVETGGSTGQSLTLYRNWKDDARQQAVVNHVYSMLGKCLMFAELRGRKPKDGITQRVSSDRVLFSSYLLCANTLEEYIKRFEEYQINCIHAYPSSLVVLARLIKNSYGVCPISNIKSIITSSEIFSKEEKFLVKEVFNNAKIIDFYGHNERACCAYSIDDGYYHFIPQYGYVEFIDTGETINNNRIAEIVATSIVSETMPFIRYATDDYVELDENNNVVSIIGRTSDFVVNNMLDITPCIVCTRTESMCNVLSFQYYQEKEGKLTFRIVVNDRHTEAERVLLLEDMQQTFRNTMECEVVIVDKIEKTKAGKQKRLIQLLDIKKYTK